MDVALPQTAAVAPSTTKAQRPRVDIKVRRPSYDASSEPYFFYGDDPVISHFIHALSMLFPEGERFFMETVLRVRDEITDPTLKADIKAFLGQEARHSLEHGKFNARVNPKAAWFNGALKALLVNARRGLSKRSGLAATCALEHFTAMMAHELLNNHDHLKNVGEATRELWLWHAVEEAEHKAVAFDVYEAVGGGYVRRTVIMVGATAIFLAVLASLHVYLLQLDGQLARPKSWGKFLRWAYKDPGMLRNIVVPWTHYFRPGFHPWDHDNRELIAQWKREHGEAPAAAEA